MRTNLDATPSRRTTQISPTNRVSDADIKQWRKRFKLIPKHYSAAMRARANDPIGRVADDLDVPRDAVEWYMKLDASERDNATRNRRNREMARLAREGLTNIEIAKRYGVHRNTVQRVIAAALNLRAPARPKTNSS